MTTILGRPVPQTGYGLMGFTVNHNNPVSDDKAIACLEEAYQRGIRFWNAGEFYGTPEHNSLHLLNKYFTKHPDHADNVVLSVKGGFVPGKMEPDGSAQNTRRSIDECLRVLDGKKFLDMFEPARVDPNVPYETTIGAVSEYVKAGKVGGISISECSAESIRRASAVHKIECVEVEVSLWATDIFSNGVATTCAELGIPIIAYSPLGRGFLTGQIKSPEDIPEGDFRRISPRFQPGVFEKNLELVRKIEQIAKKKGVTAGQIGLGWVVRQGRKKGAAPIIPIPGTTTASRIKENAFIPELTDDEEKQIDEIVAGTEIEGGRYPDAIAKMNFGDSPPLKK